MIRLLPCLALALLVSLPGGLAAARLRASQGPGPEARARPRRISRECGIGSGISKSRPARTRPAAASSTGSCARPRPPHPAPARRSMPPAGNWPRRSGGSRNSTSRSKTPAGDLERQRAALAGQLRLAHMTGGSERVRAVFNQEDPAEIGRRLTWLAYLAQKPQRTARLDPGQPGGSRAGPAGRDRAGSRPRRARGPAARASWRSSTAPGSSALPGRGEARRRR